MSIDLTTLRRPRIRVRGRRFFFPVFLPRRPRCSSITLRGARRGSGCHLFFSPLATRQKHTRPRSEIRTRAGFGDGLVGGGKSPVAGVGKALGRGGRPSTIEPSRGVGGAPWGRSGNPGVGSGVGRPRIHAPLEDLARADDRVGGVAVGGGTSNVFESVRRPGSARISVHLSMPAWGRWARAGGCPRNRPPDQGVLP